MVAVMNRLGEELERLYEQKAGRVDLNSFLAGRIPSDDALADVIEIDGRERLARGLGVELRRYLDAVPGLERMPVSLDAAIDFSLRSLSGASSPSRSAVERLQSSYPRLRGEIQSAALLGEGMWSTGPAEAEKPAPSLDLPTELGPVLESGRKRYELRERIGAGRHGAVYLAADRHLSERDHPAWVAIKVLVKPGSDALRQRIIDEATKARRVNHPNVVRVLDRGVSEDGDEYIVYEYVDGGDLTTLLKREPGWMNARTAALLVAKIARGVQAAHSAGLVHCDLKPSNIMLTKEREPKVADFGIAVRLEDARAGQRIPALGSLGFIAPEQYRGEPGAMSPPADVYGLGGVLFYLLSGGLPNGSSTREVAQNHDAETGRLGAPTIGARASVDPDLEAICGRALAPRVEARYLSADGLANDLEAWWRNEPLSWTRPTAARRALLLAKRQPLALSMLVLTVLAMVLGSAAVVGVRAGAREDLLRSELEAAKNLAAEKDRRNREVKGTIDAVVISLTQKDSGSLTAEWFPALTLVESMTGPILFEMGESAPDLWTARIETTEKMLADWESRGQGDDVESMLWRSTVTFWAIRKKDFDRAISLAQDNKRRWDGRLQPGDRWSTYLDALWASAIVLKAADQGLASVGEDSLQAAHTTLLRVEPEFTGTHRGNVLHKMVVGSLADLYGTRLLADAPASEKYRKSLDELNGR